MKKIEVLKIVIETRIQMLEELKPYDYKTLVKELNAVLAKAYELSGEIIPERVGKSLSE